MNFPKALTSLVGFGTRWFPNRINRKLDDKDNLLAEALGALESRSATDYPELTDAPRRLRRWPPPLLELPLPISRSMA